MSRHFFELSAVTRRIQELLEPAFQKTFWVQAELSSGRRRGGAFYCELVETNAKGEVAAQLRCMIWARDLSRIRKSFQEAGLELQLEDGNRIGIQCRLQFHPRFGMSLQGIDMDPAFALGELELRKRQIIERLRAEDLLSRNAEVDVPLLPNRIGLITSRDSAAYKDFVQTLHASAFGFQIFIADASVQGNLTEASVLQAFDALEVLNLDLVVLVRGGGSKVDLAGLDNEAIARRIAASSLPVWVGIGHETDTSVLDHVAGRSFKTPTAVGEELVGRFASLEMQLRESAQRLRSLWRPKLAGQREHLRRAAIGLRQGTRKLLRLSRSELIASASRLNATVIGRLAVVRSQLEGRKRELSVRPLGHLRGERRALLDRRRRLTPERVLSRLEQERRAVASWGQTLRAIDPQNNLARGFALVYRSDGRLVRSVDDLEPGATIESKLADGRVESVVQNKRRNSNDKED